MFNLSPIYSARKSSNHKLLKNHKISPAHKFTQNKTHTNVEHKTLEELVPSVPPLLKKHIRLGHPGTVDQLIYQYQIFKKCKKGMDRIFVS